MLKLSQQTYKLIPPPSNAASLSPILLVLPLWLSLSAEPRSCLKPEVCVCVATTSQHDFRSVMAEASLDASSPAVKQGQTSYNDHLRWGSCSVSRHAAYRRKRTAKVIPRKSKIGVSQGDRSHLWCICLLICPCREFSEYSWECMECKDLHWGRYLDSRVPWLKSSETGEGKQGRNTVSSVSQVQRARQREVLKSHAEDLLRKRELRTGIVNL